VLPVGSVPRSNETTINDETTYNKATYQISSIVFKVSNWTRFVK